MCVLPLFALTDNKEAWVTDIWDPLAEGGWGGEGVGIPVF